LGDNRRPFLFINNSIFMSKQNKSVFENFTGRYALSKTLRFELRVPKEFPGTKVMLDKEGVFEKDYARREKYEEAMPWIDRLHREFIRDTFSNCDDSVHSGHVAFTFSTDDLKRYQNALEAWNKDKKSKDKKNALVKVENFLRQKIADQFDACAKSWAQRYPELKLKKTNVDVLFEAGVFRVLAARYKEEEGIIKEIDGKKVNIFEGWKGWTGYFKKFFQTRRNFYSAGDESTAVAYRIVNQNLKRFCENVAEFEKVKDSIDVEKIEKDLDISCAEIFSIQYYNTCFLQNGIDAYNRVIGGYVAKNDEKVPGINQAINEYRQTHKGEKVKFLAMLDKQIHSEKDKFIDEIEDDEQLVDHLKKFIESSNVRLQAFRQLITHFSENFSIYESDWNKIYISSEAFERNAGRWFADYAGFENALVALGKTKEWKEAYSILGQKPPEEKEGSVKYPDFIIFGHVVGALNKTGISVFKEKYSEQIQDFVDTAPSNAFIKVFKHELDAQFSYSDADKNLSGHDAFKEQVESLIAAEPDSVDVEIKIAIKKYADSALTIYQMAKYFAVEKKRGWLDYFELSDLFYKDTERGYKVKFYDDAYTEIVQEYNALRNYLTKKPYNIDKWVLNFDIQTLADGWDKNKEKDNGTVILRKDNRYYLGIMHKEHIGLFAQKHAREYAGTGFEKMEYRQIANSAFDIYNLILNKDGTAKRATKKDTKLVEWPKEIVSIYEKKSYAKENFLREDFETFVDYIKKCAISYWSEFDLRFSPTATYKNIASFTDEIDKQGYKIKFVPVSEEYIKQKNSNGELFLFEIHNKDWNLKDGKMKTGSKNLHTLYWEQLFSPENKDKNFVLKLNGEAELFFRPKTDESKLGTKLINGKERVSHWRYAHNKVFFHCPITLNRVSEDKTKYETKMNADIRKLAVEKKLNIIGIDRGEKHLAYYSVINQDGKIIVDGSLNSLGETNGKTVEYAKILEERAKSRENARRDWQDVEQIKDTRRGFVSQMVRKITDLAIEYNAIIVLEDLNMRFKQVRGGIEKSIYQQFEKQLIDKLSFIVDKKETNPNSIGHPLHALQLAAPITAFKDMGKQTGIVFYTAAGYTSRTCPICGYRRNVRFQFENKKQARELLCSLDNFSYDAESDDFNITYSLSKMLTRDQLGSSKAKNKLFENKKRKDTFTLTTKNAIRYKWIPNESPRLRALSESAGVDVYSEGEAEQSSRRGVTKKFDISVYLKGVLLDAGIILSVDNLKDAICSEKHDAKFFQDILFALFMLTETRQTISSTDIDYIQCPECKFDSHQQKFQEKEFNGDANGAYNIARKGIMVVEKIRQYAEKNDIAKMGWGELAVRIEEWDKFTQSLNK
jgi:hypothetical protein